MAVSNLKLGAFTVFLLCVWEIHFFYSVKEDLYTRPPVKRSTNNCSRILKFNSSYCHHLINVEANENLVQGRKIKISENETYEKHNHGHCKDIEEKYFCHPQPTQAELDLRIAYVIVAYKGSGLIENLLRAIYMPHNVYCLHLDKKSTANFKRAVHSFIDCLPNVFITKKLIDVVWGHVSVLQAQLNCMEDLFHSDVPWKYLITLVGQDYPLYGNKGIVEGLKKLNGLNNIESYPMPEYFAKRADKIWTLTETGKGKEHDGYRMDCTGKPKAPPPHNITIMKGWNHIAATRKFVEFVLYDKIATDFYQWLSDIHIPDEVFFSSLQRHPGTPGGYHDNDNPEWIMRAFAWIHKSDNQCFGNWIRHNCWLSTRDLRWILAEKNRNNLFIQKIPFEYEENLVECLSAVVQTGNTHLTSPETPLQPFLSWRSSPDNFAASVERLTLYSKFMYRKLKNSKIYLNAVCNG